MLDAACLLIMLIGFQFGGVGEAAFPNIPKATRWKIMKNLETAKSLPMQTQKCHADSSVPKDVLFLFNAPQKV